MSRDWPEPGEAWDYEEWEPDYDAHRCWVEHMNALEQAEYNAMAEWEEEWLGGGQDDEEGLYEDVC
jgi:hypothetical protein